MPPDCPVVTAAARVPNLQARDMTKRFASGWGVSPQDAIDGCAWEMAERISGQINNDEDFRRVTAEAMGEGVVSPPEIALDEIAPIRNEQAASKHRSSSSWRRDIAIDWVSASPSLSSVMRWLPAGSCFLGHARDHAAGLLPADSNGLAAGRSLEDAAARAFVELVERDAVAIWWYNRLVRPQLDPADIGDALVSDYAIWSRDRGRPLRLIDLTHDLGIAVVAAVTHDAAGAAIAFGFGAAASASEAARHAVGELSLFECNVGLIERRVAIVGETEMSSDARRLLHWWRQGRIDASPHLAAGPIGVAKHGLYSSQQVSFDARPYPASGAGLDLPACQDICRQHGLMMLGLDLTRSFIDVPVARVVVPGLRSMSPRFAPGRLYDVPVRLGWLQQPQHRADLNPLPMVF
jgi:ribosomal protein S12 methylthiotransferase accessory factor